MDRSLPMDAFASIYLGGKCAKTGKRTVLAEGIPFYKVAGRMYVKESDAERWRESKMVTPQVGTLKSHLAAITAKVRAKKGAA